MTTTSYNDGHCEYNEGSNTLTLYRSNVLEISNTYDHGLESTFIMLPSWLAESIRTSFVQKIEEEKDKSA